GVLEESKIESSLRELNITLEDIDCILMTHLHFDHACGLTKVVGDTYESKFPNVPIITSQVECDEMRNPNMRSASTYWNMNWESIDDIVKRFKEEVQSTDHLKMIHAGGHSAGQSILVYEDGKDCFIHMAATMATHGHQNKFWVMAYDDYPVSSIQAKDKWME